MNILEAMHDENLFGPWFCGSSWDTWRVVVAALFGLPMDDAGKELYQRHTGRSDLPTSAAREAYLICGRRSGKSLIAAFIATCVW